VTAAQKLGGSITAFVAGGNIKAVAEEAAKVNGIEKIIAVDNAAYDKAGSDPQISFSLLTDDFRDFQRTTLRYSSRT
jgi:electron transfer flavoprotein alpha subunit